jgi:hypothetical protein
MRHERNAVSIGAVSQIGHNQKTETIGEPKLLTHRSTDSRDGIHTRGHRSTGGRILDTTFINVRAGNSVRL